MGFSYGSFDVFIDGRLEGIFLGHTLGSDDGTELGSLKSVFMAIRMASLIIQQLVYHLDLLIDLHFAQIKASNWTHLMMK